MGVHGMQQGSGRWLNFIALCRKHDQLVSQLHGLEADLLDMSSTLSGGNGKKLQRSNSNRGRLKIASTDIA